jgi:hypothetical protein
MKKIFRPFVAAAFLFFILVSVTGVSAQTPENETGKTITGDQIVLANTYRLKMGDELIGNLAVIGGTATLEGIDHDW